MAISDREKQLEAILQTAVDAIITIDERGIIESANPATERLFGYSVAELLGKNVKQLMPSPYLDEHDQYLANYMRTGEAKIIGIGREVIAKRKDGSKFPVDLAISEASVEGQRSFTGIVRDASDRQRAEELKTGFGRILESSLNEIYIFDAETLKFVIANRGARENIGYTMDELSELTPVDIKPDHTEQTFSELVAPLDSGKQEMLVFETVHCRKDGTHYPVEVHLQLATHLGQSAYLAIILDITERRQSARELRLRGQGLDSSAAGVTFVDLEGQLTYINKSALAMWGYENEDELVGRPVIALSSSAKDSGDVMMRLREQGAWIGERLAKRKDGSLFPIQLSASMVTDENGEPIASMGSMVDISDLKEAQRQLAQMNDKLEERVQQRTRQLTDAQKQLVRKEKLATLGQIAGGVAHEIRNPMGVIKNAVYYLQRVLTDCDEDTRDSLGEISRGLANSERIVSELLDYARGPQVEPSLFLLDEALTSALQMVKMPNSVKVNRSELFDTKVFADRGQIERLLANLIQNAEQAMPEGGSLTLRCDSVNGSVVTEVSDTGVGIAEDELEKVFEPLYTKRAKGIGLGLTLCRRYAELNGGTLDVESTLGEGSRFRVTLPLANSTGEQS